MKYNSNIITRIFLRIAKKIDILGRTMINYSVYLRKVLIAPTPYKDDPRSHMKMCILCEESKEWPYPDQDSHKLMGLHFTKGLTWCPTKGHKQYEAHLRMTKILNKSDIIQSVG